MLQPKRTKFRKMQKGRNRGLAHRGSSVSFGEFGLKATARGRLTARQIEAASSSDDASGTSWWPDLDSRVPGQAYYPRSLWKYVRVRVRVMLSTG